MPPKAAAEYYAKPLAQVTSQVAKDPQVPLANGESLPIVRMAKEVVVQT